MFSLCYLFTLFRPSWSLRQGWSDHGWRVVLQRVRQLKLQQLSQLTWRLCSTQGDPPPRQQHNRHHHHHHDYFHHQILHHHHYNNMLRKTKFAKTKCKTPITGLTQVLSTNLQTNAKLLSQGWQKYRGGLDVRGDMTGTHSVYTTQVVTINNMWWC